MPNVIHGLDAVQARLRRLGNPRKTKNAATRSARKAMNIVKKEARKNAKALDDPKSAEKIWKNIATKASRTRGNGLVVMRVGVKGGARRYVSTRANRRAGRAGQLYATQGDKKNPGGDTYYWRFVELGTATCSAHPFLRPALNNNISAINTEFSGLFSAELDKELSR